MDQNNYGIYQMIKRSALLFRDKVALKCDNQEFSYSHLLNCVNDLSINLKQLGIQKSDRIGVISKNNTEYILLYAASAKIGSIMLPINWRLIKSEIDYILKDARPKIIVAEDEFMSIAESVKNDFSFIRGALRVSEKTLSPSPCCIGREHVLECPVVDGATQFEHIVAV